VKNYIYLALAIVFEVFGSTMLKLSKGFTVFYPSVGVVVGFLVSFIFLGISLKGIPLSFAYAIWAGLGMALTAGVGVVLFKEEMSFLKTLALLLIIGGVVILNKSQSQSEKKEESVSSPSAESRLL